MDYAVCQIKGRQYIVKPNQVFEVDKISGEDKKLTISEVLLLVENGKVEIGAPFVKRILNFEVIGTVKKPKVTVMKFHAKANYRRKIGSRAQKTQLKLVNEGGKKA